MRSWRIVSAAVAVLLGVVLLALWILPAELDWNRYRGTIAELAGARLGLPVGIAGPVTLTLLPQPVLTASGVRVGSPQTDGMLIRVQALRLRVALWPLLAGRIDARELVLHAPDIHIPWPAQSDLLDSRPPDWVSAFSARVEDGRLSVGQFSITGINGSMEGLSTGGLRAAVDARIAGQSWRVTAGLTSTGFDGAAGLTVHCEGQGNAAGITAGFTGQFSPKGQLAGSVEAAGPNLSLLIPAPALRFSASGRLTIAAGLAEADELTLRLNGAPATGAVAFRMQPRPRLDIALSAARLDLDPWTPILLASISQARQLPIGLDFSADAATLHGATLQRLRAAVELVRGAVILRDATAGLPGDADLVLSGRLSGGTSTPEFEGSGRLHAPVLRTTLGWLLPDARTGLADLPAELSQSADLAGQVVIRPGQILLSKLQGSLDGQAVTGSFGLRTTARPSVALDLRFQRLRLDPLLPDTVAETPLLHLLRTQLDADLRLTVQQATLGSTQIAALVVDLGADSGRLELRRLEGSALQTHFVASATIGREGQSNAMALQLTTPDATALSGLLPVPWQATPALWHGPGRLEMKLQGPAQAIAGTMSLSLGDLNVALQPTLNLSSGSASGVLTLQSPNARRLISELGLPASLGLNGTPDWLGEGSLSLSGKAGLGPGMRISLDNAELVAGHLRARLQLALDTGGEQPVLSGQIAAETLPLPMPGDGPMPLALLHGWQARLQISASHVLTEDEPVLTQAAASLRIDAGQLHLDTITGQLSGGKLQASADLDAAATPPSLSLQAKLSGASIGAPLTGMPMDLIAGEGAATLALNASGYSLSALLASASGTLDARLQDGAVAGFDLGQVASLLQRSGDTIPPEVTQALQGGQTPFHQLRLQATIAHGILSFGTATLDGDSGDAKASGSIALPEGSADLHIILHPRVTDPPAIGLQLNGALDKPRRNLELAGLMRWKAAHHQPAEALH